MNTIRYSPAPMWPGLNIHPHFPLMLQAFANNNPNIVTTAANDTTGSGSNISEAMRTYYHRRFMDNNRSALVHEQFGTKYPIPEGEGDTINIRRFEPLPPALAPLTEGVTPSSGHIRLSSVVCAMEQLGYWVEITDRVKLTAADPILELVVGELAAQAGESRDRYVRNRIVQTTNKSYARKGGNIIVTTKSDIDATCLPTLADVRRQVTKMKNAKVKPFEDGFYVCVAHPSFVSDLRSAADFKDWQQYSESGVKRMYEGEIGIIEKVRFVETPNALVERNTEHAVFHSLFIGMNSYAVTGVGERGIETIIKGYGEGDDPLNQRMTAGWKTLVGSRVTNDFAIIDFMSGSAESDDMPAN